MAGLTVKGSPGFKRDSKAALRRAEAARLRAERLTYEEIARRLGYSGRQAAKAAVDQALLETQQEACDALRIVELQGIDLIEVEAWKVLRNTHYLVDHGRVVLDPATALPLLDDGPVLAAIDRILKCKDRRAKLLGLDAPTRVEISETSVDAEIKRLVEELADLDRRAEAAEAANTAGAAS